MRYASLLFPAVRPGEQQLYSEYSGGMLEQILLRITGGGNMASQDFNEKLGAIRRALSELISANERTRRRIEEKRKEFITKYQVEYDLMISDKAIAYEFLDGPDPDLQQMAIVVLSRDWETDDFF